MASVRRRCAATGSIRTTGGPLDRRVPHAGAPGRARDAAHAPHAWAFPAPEFRGRRSRRGTGSLRSSASAASSSRPSRTWPSAPRRPHRRIASAGHDRVGRRLAASSSPAFAASPPGPRRPRGRPLPPLPLRRRQRHRHRDDLPLATGPVAREQVTSRAVPDRVHLVRAVANVPVPGDRNPSPPRDRPDPLFVRSIDREVIIVHLDSYALGAKTRRYDVLAEVPIEKERRQLRRRLQARTGSLPRSPCPGFRSHQRDR